MLVLTRRKDEWILIEGPEGERIKVRLLDVMGNRGRIGIEAPPEFNIARGELVADPAADPEAVPALNEDEIPY